MVSSGESVVVIGSGPAGAMAALTLVHRGIPVTMLESGNRLPTGILIRAMGKTIYRKWPQNHPKVRHVVSGDPETHWVHALQPGGLSNYWTGAVPRFAPEDFSEGERLHEKYRWPIRYNDLASYYEQAERILHVTGGLKAVPCLPPSSVAYEAVPKRSWQQVVAKTHLLGQGMTPTPLAAGSPYMFKHTGAAFNSFTCIVRPLMKSHLFQFIPQAHVLRLEWNGVQRRADHVVYLDSATGNEHRLGASSIIVAAGPLSSTKLLLDSACNDFPEGLGNTSGVLGAYLHDHPNSWAVVEFDKPLSLLQHTMYVSRAAYDESAPLRAAGCVIGNAQNKDRINALAGKSSRQFGIVTFGTMVPSEQNYVRLHPTEKECNGLPKLDIHISFGHDEQRTVEEAQRRVLDIFDAAGYHGRIVSEPHHLAPGWSVHFGGTVRMHSSPQYGMLDASNRLHTVPNVLVVDASSFTTGVEKNPTLTVMAIAARAADRLADTLAGMVGGR